MTQTAQPDATTRQHGDGAHPQQPTPERIFQTLTAYQATAALKAAIELDIFTAVSEGAATAAEIAERTGASERGVRILCDYLTVHQFLTKQGARYGLAPESQIFLVRASPAYVGGMAAFLAGEHLVGAFVGTFTESVRRGTTTMPDEGSMTTEHPMWEDFARSMAAMAAPAAEMIVQLTGAASMESCKVLDIAASHGVYGISFAKANPRAEVYASDWKNVLPFARERAEREGVADRFHEIPGSAFDVDFGADYDVVLVPNFFHHFDRPTNERLMRKIHAALKPGGRCVTPEFVPDESRVSPPQAATFPLVMLGSTQAGDAYTFSEYQQMFESAGFSQSELHQGPVQQIIISHK
ncbi:MAG TPA: class I SAM-dependent methyltransferase [Pyrinomonadaceae bacterium]|nr:class I SAM-dependent methyltransferase [Pyrinomonadaceae bacterium]